MHASDATLRDPPRAVTALLALKPTEAQLQVVWSQDSGYSIMIEMMFFHFQVDRHFFVTVERKSHSMRRSNALSVPVVPLLGPWSALAAAGDTV